jgi:hypothetical protein
MIRMVTEYAIKLTQNGIHIDKVRPRSWQGRRAWLSRAETARRETAWPRRYPTSEDHKVGLSRADGFEPGACYLFALLSHDKTDTENNHGKHNQA